MINGELIVDNFAGGGGASTGIELATGYSVDIAINHDPEAIRMHQTNHPNTKHYCEDVWMVDPVKVCNGRPVGLAWFSPDCKHFSKAKGGKPKDKNIRGLAWVACRWAGLVRPRVIMLENVEEFKGWGPLNRQHHPIKAKRGTTFQKFVHQLNDLGYEVQYRELIAADYGAPTTRKRFFLIARCDGKPIVWPSPTHAIQFQNSTYDCVEKLCSRIGVDPIAILHFVKSKQYTLEQAIQEALSTTGMHRVQDADPVVFQNTVYPTLYRCYHALQIDARSVKTRMEKYHMSWEEAVEDAIKCKKTSDK